MRKKNEPIKVTTLEQKAYALSQMNLLKLKPEIANQFATHGTLFKSVNGKLIPLTDEESAMITDWEKRTDCLAYHVIYSEMYSCTLCNILYVSPFEGDCKADLRMIEEYKDGLSTYVFAYCINHDFPAGSEFGPIQILMSNEALQRIG